MERHSMMDATEYGVGFFTPLLVTDKYKVRQYWLGKSFTQLWEEADRLRVNVRDAADYRWDNGNFYISDIYGKLALQVGIYNGSMSFWNARTSVAIESFEGETFTEQHCRKIEDWIAHIEQNETQCNDCGKWISNDEVKKYSFAGGVCKDCYNPVKHLPPDTRGD